MLVWIGVGKNGILIFLVLMDIFGIDVVEIFSLIGEGDIYEVFFENVMVFVSVMFGVEG